MQTKLQPVILAGGSGTRLWPLSRKHRPKQLLTLIPGRTLLQQTIERALHVAPNSIPLIVANEDIRFLVAEQAREIGAQVNILLEPHARNTAPAIALAALRESSDTQLLIMASDHVLADPAAFASDVAKASQLAAKAQLVTFGAPATHPATGYGYIKTGAPNGPGFKIASFAEKPDAETASTYLSQGCLWNSGIFLFQAGTILSELQRLQPDLYAGAVICADGIDQDLDFERVPGDAFARVPSISIDYAVMEHTNIAETQ